VRRSHLEELFASQLHLAGLEQPSEQHTFAKPRRWRFDFAWPERQIAVEIQGGGYVYGRHNRPQGQRQDCEKFRWATWLGWELYTFTGDEVTDGSALRWMERVLDRTKEIA
jgi:very-short-patch-repair endonuclease